MACLTIAVTNPDARLDHAIDGFMWISASHVAGRPADDLSQGLSLEQAWSLAVDDLDDGILIGVWKQAGKPVEVRAFRAATSGYDLFFVRTNDGLLLTDQFASALATVPPGRRQVSLESLADHLLFRTVPGARTYVRSVERLGHGEEIVWRPGSREVFRRIRRKLAGDDSLRVGEALEVLDSVLGAVITPLARLRDIENMLSGGIDSTLVHTYLGSSIPSVSAALTSPEFRFEVDYALEASRILDTGHRLVPLDEEDYLTELERTVAAMGLPPHHLQTVLFDAVFRSAGQRFITAQFADALLGIEVDAAVNRIWSLRWIWWPVTQSPWMSRLATVTGLQKLDTLLSVGARLARPTDDPDGFALRFAQHTDMELATQILGADLVRQRLEARLAYIEERLEGNVRCPGSARSHLHVGHYIHFFCDDAVSLWRQAAQARGKALYAPFNSRRLSEAVLRIPSPDRYVRNGRVKHLLKDLLARRLPGYRVDKRKGSSGLPFARFWTQGPLKNAAERYARPDFLEPQLWRRIIREPGWLAWNVFTLALWEQLVLRVATNPPPAGVRRFESKCES